MSGATRLTTVMIEGPAGPLEGLLQERQGLTPDLVALVCHPHPLYGGTLHNKVTHRAASALHALGAAVLRFNFRGVGASAGTHDRGAGELDDARAATRFLVTKYPSARRWVGGFSFGSWVATRLAVSDASITQLILIAPPVRYAGFEALRTSRIPKLVIQGTTDVTSPPALLEEEFPTWSEPKTLIRIEGASHFFDRQLTALGDAITHALAAAARGSSLGA